MNPLAFDNITPKQLTTARFSYGELLAERAE